MRMATDEELQAQAAEATAKSGSASTVTDYDYLCMEDGYIFRGPDTGDYVQEGPTRTLEFEQHKFLVPGWPMMHKGHIISHTWCDEHMPDMAAERRQQLAEGGESEGGEE